jgi:hypothetical protein
MANEEIDRAEPQPTDASPDASVWARHEWPRRPWGVSGVLILVGLPYAVILGRASVAMWASAASVCQVMEAGGRFGATLFVWPALSLFLWAGYAIPLWLLRGRWLAIGLALGLTIALGIAYWFVSGTAPMIRASPDGQYFCPSGVPEWWPPWLPH